MAPEATLPPGDVNVPGDYFSLAGFEVIMHGRFWVLTEGLSDREGTWTPPVRRCQAAIAGEPFA
jgi:hypothetical protein